jgi:hypothetical protein
MQRKKMGLTGHCTSRIRNHFRRHITGRSEHIIRDYRSSQNVRRGVCGSPAVQIVKSLIMAWDGEFGAPLSSSTQKRGVAVFQLVRCLLACWCSRVSPSCAHVVVTVVMIVVAAAAAKDASAAVGDGALAILQVEKPNGDGGD